MKNSNKPKVRIFCVDGNWYLHRAWCTIPEESITSEALGYRILSMVCKDALAVKATHLMVAFDGPNIFRYKVYPEYKANRSNAKGKKQGSNGSDDNNDEPSKEIYEYLNEVMHYLVRAGILVTQLPKYEADDVLASVAYSESKKGNEVILGTEDKDNYQRLNSKVRMYVSNYKSKGKPQPLFIDAKYAEKVKGVPIKLMIQYQTLLGDSIDNIPGIPGFGPKKIAAALCKYGSIKEWFKNADEATRKTLRIHQSQLRINSKLVTLRKDCYTPDLNLMKLLRLQRSDTNYPKSFYSYHDFVYPKTKGLF